MRPDFEQHLQRCCVQISVGQEHGTGFFVAPNVILTCAHVVEKRSERVAVQVSWEGRSLPVGGVVSSARPYPDLARIELVAGPGSQPAPPLVRLDPDVCIQDPAYAFGFSDWRPAGDPALVTIEGRTGSPERRLKLKEGQIRPGMSGGPLLNLRTGMVCGIVQKSRDVASDLGGLALGVTEILEFLDGAQVAAAWHASDGRWDALVRAHLAGTRGDLPPTPGLGVERFVADYLGTAARPVPFGGRTTELDALDAWLADAPEPCLLLCAPAGRGKSALLVRWVERLRGRAGIATVFYPISIRFRTNLARAALPAMIAGVAAAQGVRAPGQFEASIAMWKATLSSLLARPPPPGAQLVLVLDGIDEAADWEADQDLFPLELPPRVRVIASARTGEQDVHTERWLRALGWDDRRLARSMRLEALTPRGVADVLVRMGVPLDRLGARVDIIAEIHRLTEGDPLLVGLYVSDLWTKGDEVTRLTPADLASIRPGLDGYFDRWWEDQRRLWGGEAPLRTLSLSMVVNLLASAQGPLTRDDLLQLLPTEAQLRTSVALVETLEPLSRFLIGDGLQAGYAFSHPRLAGYFHGRMGPQERRAQEERFLAWGREVLARLAREPAAERDRYAVQFYGAHLARADAPARDLMALVDVRWMRAWARLSGGYAGFVADVARAHRRAVRSNQEAIARGERPHLEWEIQCTLWQTSINSLARELPTELAVALIEDGLWTVADGIEHARRLPTIQQRARAIATLLDALPMARRNELLLEALRVAAAADGTEAWPTVFATLHRYLPGTIEQAPVGNPSVENPPVENPSVENPPVENTPVENTPVENPPVENTPVENPPVENGPTPEQTLRQVRWFVHDHERHVRHLQDAPGSLEEVRPARARYRGALLGVAWAAAAESAAAPQVRELLEQLASTSGLGFRASEVVLEMVRLLELRGIFETSSSLALPALANESPDVLLLFALHLPPAVRVFPLRAAVAKLAAQAPHDLTEALSAVLELRTERDRRPQLEALAPAVQAMLVGLAFAHEERTPAHGDPDAVVARFVADDMPASRHRELVQLLEDVPRADRAAAVDPLLAVAHTIEDWDDRLAFLVALLTADPRRSEPLAPDLALELLLRAKDGLEDFVVRRVLLTLPRLAEALEPVRLMAFARRLRTEDAEFSLMVLPPELLEPVWSTLPPQYRAISEDERGLLAPVWRVLLPDPGPPAAEVPGEHTRPVVDADWAVAVAVIPFLRLGAPDWRAQLAQDLRARPGTLRRRMYAVLGLGDSEPGVRDQLLAPHASGGEIDPTWRDLVAVLLHGPSNGRFDAAWARIEALEPVDGALACALLAPHAPEAVFDASRMRFGGELRRMLIAQLWPHLRDARRRAAIDELLAAVRDLFVARRDRDAGDAIVNGMVMSLPSLIRLAREDEPSLLLFGVLQSLTLLDDDVDDRGATLALATSYRSRIHQPWLLRDALWEHCQAIHDPDERAPAEQAIAGLLLDHEQWVATIYAADSMPGDRDEWLLRLLDGIPAPERATALERLMAGSHTIAGLEDHLGFVGALVAADPRRSEPLAPDLALELLLLKLKGRLEDFIVRRILLALPRLAEALVAIPLARIIGRLGGEDADLYVFSMFLPPDLLEPVRSTVPPEHRAVPEGTLRDLLGSTSGVLPAAPDLAGSGAPDEHPEPVTEADCATAVALIPFLRLAVPDWRVQLEQELRARPGTLRARIYAVLGLGDADAGVREQLLEQRADGGEVDPVWRDLAAVLLDGPGEGRIDAVWTRIGALEPVDGALACMLLAPHATEAVFDASLSHFRGDLRRMVIARLWPHLQDARRRAAADELLAPVQDVLADRGDPNDDAGLGQRFMTNLPALIRVVREDESSLLYLGAMRSLALLDSTSDDRGPTLVLATSYLSRIRQPCLLRDTLLALGQAITDPEERAAALRALAAHLSLDELWTAIDGATGGLLTELERNIPDQARRWRADRSWLVESLIRDRDEQLDRVIDAIPDHRMGAALAGLRQIPAAGVMRLAEHVAPRVDGVALAVFQLMETSLEPGPRLALASNLLRQVRPPVVPALEELWLRTALEIARSCTTPEHIAPLRRELFLQAPGFSGSIRSRLGEVVRGIGPVALRTSFLVEVFSVLPEATGLALVRESIEISQAIEVRKSRLSSLLELAHKLQGPSRRLVLEEALRTTQMIDDGRERVEGLVALAPWADETVQEAALNDLAEIIEVSQRARLLGRLVPHLREPERSIAARSALSAVLIGNCFTQAEGIRALCEQLGRAALSELCDSVEAIPFERERARAVCVIAPLLDPAHLARMRRVIRTMSDTPRVTALIGLAHQLTPEAMRDEIEAAAGMIDPAAAARLAVAGLRRLPGGDLTAAIAHAVAAVHEAVTYRGRRNDLLELAAIVPPQVIPGLVAAARRGGNAEHFVAVVAVLAARQDGPDHAALVAEARTRIGAIEDCEQRAGALAALARAMPAEHVEEDARAVLAAARTSWSVRVRAGAVAALGSLLSPDVMRKELEAVLAHPHRETRLVALELLGRALPEPVQREAIRRVSAAVDDAQGEGLMALARSLPASLAPDLLAAARLIRHSEAQSRLVSMVSSRTEMLQTAERYLRLSQSLNVLASGPRAGFLLSLDALSPALVEIGGAEVARAAAQFIVEAKTWW